MAEKKEKDFIKSEKQDKRKVESLAKAEKKKLHEEESTETLIRISGYDIPGSKNIFTGLTRIKGVSWAVSNAVCVKLGIPKSKKIIELSKPEIQQIEEFLKTFPTYSFLKNRRFDRESGETNHFIGPNLDIKREFDIKHLKEIKSYRGLRHSLKLPVRGQRTKSHFRSKGTAMGVKRKSK